MRVYLRFIFLVVLCVLLYACSSSLPPAGYYQARDKQAELWLNDDGKFTLLLNEQTEDSLLARVTGNWLVNGKNIHLQCQNDTTTTELYEDSLSRFTSISSFHFRDSRNRPVPIRYILLGKGSPKPHFGNSLYFFAGDFHTADTIRFYFNGYPSFQYPGSVPRGIGDNAHFVTLHEPAGSSKFADTVLHFKRKTLQSYVHLFEKKKEALP